MLVSGIRKSDTVSKWFRNMSEKWYSFTVIQEHVVQSLSCVWLFRPGGTLGFSVFHRIPEFVPTHVYWVGDAIQPSVLCRPPSPPALNLSQLQALFSVNRLFVWWPNTFFFFLILIKSNLSIWFQTECTYGFVSNKFFKYLFRFFSCVGYYKILSIDACSIQ